MTHHAACIIDVRLYHLADLLDTLCLVEHKRSCHLFPAILVSKLRCQKGSPKFCTKDGIVTGQGCDAAQCTYSRSHCRPSLLYPSDASHEQKTCVRELQDRCNQEHRRRRDASWMNLTSSGWTVKSSQYLIFHWEDFWARPDARNRESCCCGEHERR